MLWSFQLGDRVFEMLLRCQARADDEALDFSDERAAYEFLMRLAADRDDEYRLRCMADELMYVRLDPLLWTPTSTVCEQLARRVVLGQLLICERKELTHRPLPNPLDRMFFMYGIQLGVWEPEPDELPQMPPPAAEEPTADLSWIKIRVVDDATGKPISGVALHLKAADGYEVALPTRVTGNMEIQAIAAGPCEISCPLEGKHLGQIVAHVGQGPSATGAQNTPSGLVTPDKAAAIAHVEARKVTRADTPQGLAEQAGMSWEELAEFNFGTRDPERVQRCLASFVGCTRRTKDGYAFDDADDPGIVFIPRPWSAALETGQEYILRVRACSHVVRLGFHVNLAATEAQEGRLVLETDDGTWKHTIRAADRSEVEPDGVELEFPRPPAGRRYNLIHDPGAEGKPVKVYFSHSEDELWLGNHDEREVEGRDDRNE